MAQKTKLNGELRGRLRTKFPRQLQNVADRVKMEYAPFRQMLTRNVYPQDVLERLCELTGLPTDLEELGTAYTFELSAERTTYRQQSKTLAESAPSRQDLVQYLGERFERVIRLMADLEDDVAAVYKSMGEEDGKKGKDLICLVTFDDLPLEWEGLSGHRGIFREAARCVKKGCCLLYVVPSQTLLDALTTVTPSVGQKSEESFRMGFRRFREMLERHGGLSRKEIEERTALLASPAPLYFSPQHKYVLFQHLENDGKEGETVMVWAMVLCPTGRPLPAPGHRLGERGAFLPLNQKNMKALTNVVYDLLIRESQKPPAEENTGVATILRTFSP